MPRLLIISTITLSVMLSSACTSGSNGNEQTGEIVRGDVIQRISINGTLRSERQAQVLPGYAGYVGKIFVSVGQKVVAGQPLVSVLQTISQPLSEVFPIRSPFNGVVTQILRREGEYVTSGSNDNNTLILVDDITRYWVSANVPEVDIAKVQVGLEAQIKANALPAKLYKGVVRTISLSSRQSTDRWDRGRTEYPIEIEVTEADDSLRTGMTVVADVISAKAEGVPTVRHEFLFRDREGYFVKDLSGKEHRLEIGLSNEEVAEITKGGEVGLRLKMKDFAGEKRGPNRRR